MLIRDRGSRARDQKNGRVSLLASGLLEVLKFHEDVSLCSESLIVTVYLFRCCCVFFCGLLWVAHHRQ